MTNVATVSTPGDIVPGNNTASDPTPVAPAPLLDLAIVKTATTPFMVGANATYQLTVNNISLAPTSGTTTITDLLPMGLTYVSATGTGWTCSFSAGAVSCTFPAVLAAGASSNVLVTVAVDAAAAPSVSNTGVVQSPGDSNPNNDRSTITTPVQLLDVAIAKSGPGTARAGATFTYTVVVHNRSSFTARNVQVTDLVPAELTLVAIPSGATIRNGVVTWSLGDMSAGATRTLTVQVKVNPNVAAPLAPLPHLHRRFRPDQRAPRGDRCAVIVADDIGAAIAEREDKSERVAHQIGQAERGEVAVVIRIPAGGAAIAALVRRDDMIAGLAERQHHLAPAIGQLRKAVQQQEAWPAPGLEAGFEQMNRQAVDIVDATRADAARQRVEQRIGCHSRAFSFAGATVALSLQSATCETFMVVANGCCRAAQTGGIVRFTTAQAGEDA